MVKSKRKRAIPAKKTKKIKKTAEGRTKTAEYVSNLMELHRLQGVLLNKLNKEVQ